MHSLWPGHLPGAHHVHSFCVTVGTVFAQMDCLDLVGTLCADLHPCWGGLQWAVPHQPWSRSVLVPFPVAVINYSDQSNLRKKRFYKAHNSILTGTSRQEELEATDHIAVAVESRAQ